MDSCFVLSFFFPAELLLESAGPEEAKNLAGEKVLRLIQIHLTTVEFEKIPPACQDNSRQGWIAISISIDAVSFSSARTTKRFPSRCASATKIVCPLELIVETQPQLQPALLRLSAMISQYLICGV